MAKLGRIVLIGLLVAAAMTGSVARGEEGAEIFVPPTPPETTAPVQPISPAPRQPDAKPAAALPSLVGSWSRVDKGNPTCGKTTMTVRSSGGRLSGTTSTGGTVGQFKVNGASFSFVEDYTDLLGNAVSIRYSGQLSADGNGATATISGSWQDGCTSTFTRLGD